MQCKTQLSPPQSQYCDRDVDAAHADLIELPMVPWRSCLIDEQNELLPVVVGGGELHEPAIGMSILRNLEMATRDGRKRETEDRNIRRLRVGMDT